jgi:hypothetical protein
MNVALATVLLSCSSVPSGAARDKRFFEGEIYFWGEFNLYPYARGHEREADCMSGTLPLQDQVVARKSFDGKQVRVYGKLVPYRELDDAGVSERGWRGAPIPNYCSGNDVILADRIELIKP